MSRFAVFSGLDKTETSGWFVNEVKKVIQVSFYTKLGTNLLSDCINTPRDLYMGITNNMYNFKSPKSIEFGVVRSSGNLGSYSEVFYADKENKLIELFKANGFEIIRK